MCAVGLLQPELAKRFYLQSIDLIHKWCRGRGNDTHTHTQTQLQKNLPQFEHACLSSVEPPGSKKKKKLSRNSSNESQLSNEPENRYEIGRSIKNERSNYVAAHNAGLT
jgi:hypothetical protein